VAVSDAQPIAMQRRQTPARRPRRGRRRGLKEQAIALILNGRIPAFMLGTGLLVMLVAFAMSDDFAVDRVIVRGNSIAYADRVVEQSGALGESIFQVNTHDVAERVAAHPVVESVSVRAALPNRVIVNVVEREPAMVWQTGDRAVLIDQHGWVLAEGTRAELPRVVELSGELPAPGARIDPANISAVEFLVAEFGDDMTLEYDEIDGFIVHVGREHVLVLGDARQIPVKMAVYESMLGHGADWSRLDVRDPTRPVFQ
jgi:cell division protein FtsQ